MANDTNNVAEENFNKFRESLYQYLDGSIKDFDAIKPQLLDIFKTHRPIRKVDYQYGISKSLKPKSQLTVHECNQRPMVREYFKTGKNDWHCCECNRTSAPKNDEIADLLVQHGIVFVKLKHDCAPRQLSFVQKVQKLYKEKKVEEADALQKEVLGSEDLIIPVKQKSDASKPGTKACSPKVEEDIIAEVKLRLAQHRSDNGEDEGSYIIGKDGIENFEKLLPEEAFAKIIENLKEYTNDSKEAVMANKSKILSCLKVHRPIKNSDCLYGVTQDLHENRRLIVFEWNDRKRVREYTKKNGSNVLWICRECYCLYNRRKLRQCNSYLYLINGIAFVETNHASLCKPRDYELVMIHQKFLHEGNRAKARGMARTINFYYGEGSWANVKNFLGDITSLPALTGTLHERNSETLTNLKRRMASNNDNISLDEKPPVHKKSKLNKAILVDTVNDENVPGLFDEKLLVRNKSKSKKSKQHVDEEVDSIHIKPAPSASTLTSSIYHFEKPSTSKLQEICDKLNIEYRSKAAKLWDKIEIDQIDTESNPSKTHFFETDNFYQILSIFFTGKSKQHELIKTTIIDAFRGKLVSSGEVSTKKFNREYLDTVTGKHFSFIAKYLSCRILIFDGENGIKKYGKWKSTTSIRLTLVVALVDGYYSIVLNL